MDVDLSLDQLQATAVRILAGLLAAVVLALAFALASLLAVFGPAGGRHDAPNGLSRAGQAAVQQASAAEVVPAGAASAVVSVAETQAGTAYVWGGASPATGFDCSGLVQWAFSQVGVSLPRTAQAQYDATQRVAVQDLRPGDLVFFAQTYASSDYITHVGIYTGNGIMLNAPTTGDVIRPLPVFTGYWADHYAGAGRPAGAPP